MELHPRTIRVAEFVADTDVDPAKVSSIRSHATAGVLDTIAVMVAGASATAPRVVASLCTPDPTGSAVLGFRDSLNPLDAALVGGVAAHVLDFDDVHIAPRLGHPSATILPAMLAVAQVHDISGADFLDAYAVAVEVGVHLGTLLGEGHYLKGWHATGNLGSMRATAGCCRILGLNPQETARALGIASSMAGGLRVNFGTMTKSLHAGNAARAGVASAVLAERGFTGHEGSLDEELGFLDAFSADRSIADEEISELGGVWELERGLVWKEYPSCAASHSSIEAALGISRQMNEKGVSTQDIDHVYVLAGKDAGEALRYHRPATPLEAKFCAEYCVATALLDGAVTLQHFTADALRRPKCKALVERTVLAACPSHDTASDADVESVPPRSSTIHVKLRNGRCLQAVATGAKTNLGMSRVEALRRKFAACFAYAHLGADATQSVWQDFESLESAESVRSVVEIAHAKVVPA